MKVVDASAVAAVMFDEPAHDYVKNLMRGEALIAPPLLVFELANACVKKIRNRPAERDLIERAYAGLDDWKISYLDIELRPVLTLAADAGLSWWDASYLWLASELRCQLVTLDERLAKAAAARP